QRLAERATPIQRVHVSDRGHAGFVNLAAADYGPPWLRAPASSWRVSVSGNASPNARRPSSEYTSATAVMPGL
ncbi:hypothetical protein CJ430_17740, partial [Klebsiella pneumoniae]